MSAFFTVYCDSPHCEAGRNSAEIELSPNLEDFAPTVEEMDARLVDVLRGLGWRLDLVGSGWEHICPDCVECEGLRELSGLNPD